MMSHTFSNEMQLDMLSWLLLLFFRLFSWKKPNKLSNKGTIDEASLNKETRRDLRSNKVTKVMFYWVKIQLTSFGFSVPCMSTKALVSSVFHGPDVDIQHEYCRSSTKWADCRVKDASPTDNCIPVHINQLQSTYRWCNPLTGGAIHLQSTFVWHQSSVDRINLPYFGKCSLLEYYRGAGEPRKLNARRFVYIQYALHV